MAASIGSQQPTAVAATNRLAEDKLGRRILVSLLTVIFYYYPSILTTTLSTFTCHRLDTPATLEKYSGNARVSPVLDSLVLMQHRLEVLQSMHPLITFPGWLPQHPSMNCPMETLNAYAQVDWVLYARRLQKRCLSLFQCTCVCVCLSLSLCLCLSLSLSVSLSVSVSVHDLSVRVCAMAGQVAWWVLAT